MTTAMNVTPAQVYRVAKDPVAKLIALQLIADKQREMVDQRHQAILDSHEYLTEEGERITDPRRDYRICDDQAAELYAAYDAANVAAGCKDLKPGHCPALTAEHDVIKAEWEVIHCTAALFGMDPELMYGDIRERYLKLVIGFTLATER